MLQKKKKKLKKKKKKKRKIKKEEKEKKSYLRIQWRLIFAIIILSSRLPLWKSYVISFKFTHFVILTDVLSFN